ncbi:MAG: hypothetical protein AAFW98_07630 [Pseudomonadota bacterium]
MTLVEDACASSTRVAHDDALQRMSDGGLIRVRKTAEIENLIQSAAVANEPEAVPG